MDVVCSFIVSREQYDGYSVQCAEGSLQYEVCISLWLQHLICIRQLVSHSFMIGVQFALRSLEV